MAELDPLAKGSFPVRPTHTYYCSMMVLMRWFLQGYSSLNRVQSIVYPTAYGSNENMLICGTSSAASLMFPYA